MNQEEPQRTVATTLPVSVSVRLKELARRDGRTVSSYLRKRITVMVMPRGRKKASA